MQRNAHALNFELLCNKISTLDLEHRI